MGASAPTDKASDVMTALGILCGLPLSGKSTNAKTLREEHGWVIVCPDEIRLALHGRDYLQSAEPFVWAATELMARSLLRNGHCVLIDATNTTHKRRIMWLKLAQEFDLELIAFVVDTPAHTCKDRASLDNKPWMHAVIDRMADQWEPVEEESVRVMSLGV